MSEEGPNEPPIFWFTCTFCSRQVFTDGTINLGCGYCSRKTRAEIEQERRPWHRRHRASICSTTSLPSGQETPVPLPSSAW